MRSVTPVIDEARRRVELHRVVFSCGIRAIVSSHAMTAVRMDGEALAAGVACVTREWRELGHVGLATVLVGDDEASTSTSPRAQGCRPRPASTRGDVRLSTDTSEADVLGSIDRLNDDRRTSTAILVQLPLPSHMSETKVTYAVSPGEGRRRLPSPQRRQSLPRDSVHVPATPSGCMELLREYGIDPSGKEAVVIGRSEIVGRPMAMLLMHANATVTVCHSRTADLAAHVRRADIVVAAVGRPGHRHGRHGEAGSRLPGRRADPHGGRNPRRHRRLGRERGGVPDPDARRYGADDDRDAPRSTLKAARYRRGLLAFPGS